MRLTPTHIDTINRTSQAVLGEGARVTLFGPRLTTKRGAGMWTC